MFAAEWIGRAEIHRHAMLHDLVLLENLVEYLQRPARVDHVVFADDLKPVDGGLVAQDVIVMRDAQTDADPKIGEPIKPIRGHEQPRRTYSPRRHGGHGGHGEERITTDEHR